MKDEMTRWNALVRYDDEIREAAEGLRPFGKVWITKLGQEFFALNEDRTYLPNIVAVLVAEAEAELKRAEEEQKRQNDERLMYAFRVTADGKLCSEESLNILREAIALGYQLEVQKDKTITATRPGKGYTSYLRSNSDILQFSRFEKFRQK